MIPKKAASDTVVIHLMEENIEQILLSGFTAEKKEAQNLTSERAGICIEIVFFVHQMVGFQESSSVQDNQCVTPRAPPCSVIHLLDTLLEYSTAVTNCNLMSPALFNKESKLAFVLP